MADREIVYRISVAGIGEVRQALRGIMELLRQQGRDEVSIAKVTGDSKKKIRTEEEVLAEKLRKAGLNASLKARNAEVAAFEKALKAKTSAEDKARRKTETEDQKQRDKTTRAVSKALEELIQKRAAAEKKMRADREREVAETEKSVTKMMAASSAERMRQYLQEQRMRTRAAEQSARDSESAWRRVGSGLTSGFGGGLSRGASMLGHGVYRGVTSVASGVGVMGALDTGEAFQRTLALMGSSSYWVREGRKPGTDQSEINGAAAMEKVRAIALKYGRPVQDVTEGVDKGFALGQGPRILGNMDAITKDALRMNMPINDVVQTRATLMNSKEGMSDEGQQAWMDFINIMGKSGAMRGSEIAAMSSRLISGYASTGANLEEVPLKFLAMVEKAKTIQGTGARTTTAVRAVFGDIIAKADKLHDAGVDVYDKDMNMRDVFQVLKETIVKEKGNPTKLTKLFAGTKGGSIVLPLAANYNHAEKAKEGAGAQYLDDFFDAKSSLGNFTPTRESLREDAIKDDLAVLESPTQKLAESLGRLREQMDSLAQRAIKWYMENEKDIGDALKMVINLVSEHPVLAGAGVLGAYGAVGALKGTAGAALGVAGNALGSVISRRFGGAVGGAIGQAIGGAVASSGSTPVFITGAAPGVLGGMGGGGGFGGAAGGLSGLSGLGGLGGAGGALGLSTLATGGLALGVLAAGTLGAMALSDTDSSGQPRIHGREMTDADRTELSADKTKREERDADIGAKFSTLRAQELELERQRKTAAAAFPDLVKAVEEKTKTPQEAALEAQTRAVEGESGPIRMHKGADGLITTDHATLGDALEMTKFLDMLGKFNAQMGPMVTNMAAVAANTSQLKSPH